jgi:predicted permease
VRIIRVAGRRLRSLFRRASVEAEMEREFDLHLEQLTRQYLAEGLSEIDARTTARRDFGSVESMKEQCRDMRRVTILEDVLKDLAYAFRILKKSPGFTLTAVGSLALGIGANTAIFSIVNAFLLRPLPFEQPDRLVTLSERDVNGSGPNVSVAPGNFLNWQQSSTTFASISAYTTQGLTLSNKTPGFEPQRVVACACSGNLFATLGISPLLGRTFTADEDREGAPRVAAISHSLWQRQFGGAADLIGKPIWLNDQDYQITAVLPPTFAFPSRTVEVWMPLRPALPPPLWLRHDLHFLQVVGRIRRDVPRERAVAEIDGISAAYKNSHPEESTGRGAAAMSLQDALVTDVRTPLIVLLAAVGCVLLIACVNLANLMLTRSAARAREIGIRTALGAGRGRLVRQLLTESLVLAAAGGAVGVALAMWIARLLAARAPGADLILPTGTVPVDPIVFLFAFAVAILTGLAVGLVPAVRGSRDEVTNELKDGTRSATAGRAHGRFRSMLVATEVALSLTLLVAAGLLIHSLSRLYDVRTGIRMDHMLTMSVSLPSARYPDPAKRSALLAGLGERLRTLPGVRSAGLTSCTPLTGPCNILFFYIEGRPFVPGNFFTAHERSVDPAYFETAAIPLLKGRTFTKEDGVGFDAQHPRIGKLVISESMAKTFFSGDDPIGKRIFFDFELQRERNQGIPAPRYEVIGVVGDVVPSLDTKMTPTLYRPLLDVAGGGAAILLHTAVDPESILTSVRSDVRGLDSGLVIAQVRTMQDLVGRSTSDRRFTMFLFIAFAALAVLLAGIGLYGVVSYAVSQRTAEIGIRIALGATTTDVTRLVVMQGLRPALIGIGLGLISAAFASRLLTSLLFGVTPADPLTYLIVPPALLSVAALASYMPALRAVRLDPTTALRTE